MTISGANNLISFQESQLIHMLQQQPSRAQAEVSAENRRAWIAAGGQNLPGAERVSNAAEPTADSEHPIPNTVWEPLDPDLSPENIDALLRARQTQQASLETTILLDSSTIGAGGRTLLDYLATSETVVNDAANDDGDAVSNLLNATSA